MAETKKEAIQTAPAEPKYKLDILRRNSRKLFGVSSSTFEAAVSSLKADGEYTKESIRRTIEEWLKKPCTPKKEGK